MKLLKRYSFNFPRLFINNESNSNICNTLMVFPKIAKRTEQHLQKDKIPKLYNC